MVPLPPVQRLSSTSSSFSSPASRIAVSRTSWNFPKISMGNVQLRRSAVKSQHIKSNLPLVSPDDQWGNLAVLFSAGAFGIWSEKTKIGSALSGPLVTTLVGLAANNFGIIASEASTFPIEFLLPLAYPLLLFRADLRRVIKPTVMTLLPAFLLGSVGTMIGSVMAHFLVPMRLTDQNYWKFGAILKGMHVRGVDKDDAISDAFDAYFSVCGGGLAADNVTRAVYFAILLALASKVPPETTTVNDEIEDNNKLPVLQSATSIAVSFTICKVGSYLTKYFGIRGGTMQAITAVTVILATIFPKRFAYLASSGEAMATVLMQVFFAAVGVGARKNISNTEPYIFKFSLVQILVHFAITIGLGKWLRFDLKSLVIASIGNVGGPTAVFGMAAAKGWDSIVISGILAGILRMPIASFLGNRLLRLLEKK